MVNFTTLVTIVMFTATPSSAVDITVGATTWYSWWDLTEDGSTEELGTGFSILFYEV